MKLIPGKLYRVNLIKRKSAYERNIGIEISAVPFWKRKGVSFRLKTGDILLFIKKGEHKISQWCIAAHTPYTFLYNDKIIEFHKRYDQTLGSIFEEFIK